MRNIFVGIVVCALVACAGRVEAGLVFANPITGTNPNTSDPYTDGQTFHPNVTVSGIGRGSGIVGANANNRYNANSWDTAALDPAAYFFFQISPVPNYQISFEKVEFTIQRNHASINNFAFRSSLDGFATNIGSVISNSQIEAASATLNSLSLSGLEFQNIANTIEFRLYAWGADQSSRTFSVNDFTFNGTVSAVPEPSSFLLLGLAGAFGAVMRNVRRRRLANANLRPSSPMPLDA